MSRTEARGITRRELLRGAAAFGCVAAVSSIASASNGVDGFLEPVRFALLGDWGSGDEGEMAIAERMLATHRAKPLDLIIGAGDNIYPNGSASHFRANFERPFEGLIQGRVPFYTCFGNHDVRAGSDAQLRYPLFNMNGNRYYRVARGNGTVEFFMLDSNDMDDRQVRWLDAALASSTALWKIPVLHHPPFSSGKRHGSSMDLRKLLEPIFVRHKVQAVFSGHDHIYQRVVPQQGVQYFVSGAGGKIRKNDLDERDRLVAKGYTDDSHFMVVEADAVSFRFSAVNTRGETVDSGQLFARAGGVSKLLARFRAA